MNRTASTISFWIAGLLFLVMAISMGISFHDASKRLDGAEEDAKIAAIKNGKEIIEAPDNTLDGSTLLVLGLAGGAFLVAGFALRPKAAV